MTSTRSLDSKDDYTIGWIAALPTERAAAEEVLDEQHDRPLDFIQPQTDKNSYTWGRIEKHNIVIASLEAGVYGTTPATTTAISMLSSFPQIRFGLLVGIGGGIPKPTRDLRLGDIVVSQPSGSTGGVIQYDHVKAKTGGQLERKDFLNKPPQVLLNALSNVQAKHKRKKFAFPNILRKMADQNPEMFISEEGEPGYNFQGVENDQLFDASYEHVSGVDCSSCDTGRILKREQRRIPDNPKIHYGVIASGNTLVKNALVRDEILRHLPADCDCICYEMEAAGLMNSFPCLVIRGICDYADSHKNDQWQPYAAATAAAFAKELLTYVPEVELGRTQKAADVLERLDKFGKRLETVLAVSEAAHTDVINIQTSNRRRTIIEWLSPRTGINTAVLDYGIDTSKNIFTAPLFQHWLASSGNLLWCYGDSGSGKTVLISMLSQSLGKLLPTKTFGILTYFYDHRDTKSHSKDAFLKSLLVQAIALTPEVPLEVENLYADAERDHASPSSVRLEDTLRTVLRSMSGVIILVDAFDECQHRKNLVPILHSLAGDGISILVTSRNTPDIEKELRTDKRIEICPTDDDLRSLAMSRLGEVEEELELDLAFKEDMVNKVVAQSRGNFLLARLIVNDLIGASNKKEMRQTLMKLPATLPEMYEKTLQRIHSSRHANMARRVVNWVTHAKRPLHIQELRHAFAVENGATEIDAENLTSKSVIISACLGMVALGTDDIVRLIHASAYEYMFAYNPESADITHHDYTSTCLTYLSFTAFAAGPCLTSEELGSRIKNHPFGVYAATYLGYHCQGVESHFLDLLLSFVQNKKIRDSAVQLFYYEEFEDDAIREETFNMLPKSQGALHVACRLGFVGTSRLLLSSGHDLWVSDSQGWSPLISATSYGHEDVIKLLLDAGARAVINQGDGQNWTPLIWSVLKDHINITKQLLDAGADLAISDTCGWTAMHWAAYTGNSEVIALLSPEWDRRRPIRPFRDRGRSDNPDQHLDPLLITVDHGNFTALDQMIEVHSRSFEPLMPEKDDLNCDPGQVGALHRFLTKQDKCCGTYQGPGSPSLVFPKSFTVKLLDSAIKSNHLNMVKLLFERGIGASYTELNRRTPLHTSVFCDDPEIPMFLLTRGFKITTRDDNGYSVMDLAARNGTASVIRRLLGFPDLESAIQGTVTSPLHLIWANSRLLNPQDLTTSTPSRTSEPTSINAVEELQQTERKSFCTKIEIADLLLSLGADINKRDTSGMSPLFLALNSGVETVKFLLERGARTDVIDSSGNTLLHHCILDHWPSRNVDDAHYQSLDLVDQQQRYQVMQLFLDHGVEISAKNQDGKTALCKAISWKESADVLWLMNHGAEVHDYGNALEAVSCKSGGEIVLRLLNRCFDIDNAAKGNGCDPKISIRDHLRVVKMLLGKGLQMDAESEHYNPVLQAVWSKCEEKLTEVLLDRGTQSLLEKMNETTCGISNGDEYRFPLQIASSRGYKKVVQLLLDGGSDVNAQGGDCGDALRAASYHGHDEIVQILLDRGADIDAQGGGDSATALRLASLCGNDKIVQKLLDRGANVNAQRGSALQAASSSGHENTVQILIDRGANVNAQGGYYGYALQAASHLGHEKIVQTLLDRGADTNAQGGEFGNALQAAAFHGRKVVIKLLLENGANVNAQGGKYGNALQAASYWGHEDIVQILLDRGADINA